MVFNLIKSGDFAKLDLYDERLPAIHLSPLFLFAHLLPKCNSWFF
ncbi:MAG: hypothetical protein AB7N80_13535 [Bdellovibrionales bacterium]